MVSSLLVTGFLGAGKSALATRLRQALPGIAIVEADGRAGPGVVGSDTRIVAVADAANLPACLGDPLVGPLVAAQIGAAGLVVLTRTDIAPGAPARAALAGVTGADVVDVSPGPLPDGLAARLAALPARIPEPPRTAVPFADWRYSGPATLRAGALEALAAARPPGLYRLSGVVRVGRHGVEVDLVGRLRQFRPVPLPEETTLVAIGPRARFRPQEMALAFSQAVAAGGWLSGIFGHR